MDIRRLLALSGINESVSPNPETNNQIEYFLSEYDQATQTVLIDALDALRLAGDAGLTVDAWAEKLKELHGDLDTMEIMNALRNAAKTFTFCVKRIGDRHYAWYEMPIPEPEAAEDNHEEELPPEVKQAVGAQVGMAHSTLSLMREKGTFTVAEIAADVARLMGLPAEVADAYARHLIDQMPRSFETLGNDRFRYVEEKRQTTDDHMSFLRDIARKGGDESENKEG